MKQQIITPDNDYEGLETFFYNYQKALVVCDESIRFLKALNNKLSQLDAKVIRFSDFQPNPLYESVVEGVKVFRQEKCDCIVAIGGGSAMDVAKCIKLFCNMDGDGTDGSFLKQSVVENSIPLLAIPTTAGTGSEATRYAVVYYDGMKQSITSNSIIPDIVLMDPTVLDTLPLYQKKATMCDALCHAIESYWSVNSTEESKEFSKNAIRAILSNMAGYLNNTNDGKEGMLYAAHYAGKAINITQTTAGHAMCYKITSLFGVAHGHAAMLCDRVLFKWMIDNVDKCIDSRGEKYLARTFEDIANAMGCASSHDAAKKLETIFEELELEIPRASAEQFKELVESVNPVRMKNHPIKIDVEQIKYLYQQILNGETI